MSTDLSTQISAYGTRMLADQPEISVAELMAMLETVRPIGEPTSVTSSPVRRRAFTALIAASVVALLLAVPLIFTSAVDNETAATTLPPTPATTVTEVTTTVGVRTEGAPAPVETATPVGVWTWTKVADAPVYEGPTEGALNLVIPPYVTDGLELKVTSGTAYSVDGVDLAVGRLYIGIPGVEEFGDSLLPNILVDAAGLDDDTLAALEYEIRSARVGDELRFEMTSGSFGQVGFIDTVLLSEAIWTATGSRLDLEVISYASGEAEIFMSAFIELPEDWSASSFYQQQSWWQSVDDSWSTQVGMSVVWRSTDVGGAFSPVNGPGTMAGLYTGDQPLIVARDGRFLLYLPDEPRKLKVEVSEATTFTTLVFDSTVWSSEDGRVWEEIGEAPFSGSAFGSDGVLADPGGIGQLVATSGTSIWWSINGVDWYESAVPTPPTESGGRVFAFDGRVDVTYLAIWETETGSLVYGSRDGATWYALALPDDAEFESAYVRVRDNITAMEMYGIDGSQAWWLGSWND
jgi:hypothetical protein